VTALTDSAAAAAARRRRAFADGRRRRNLTASANCSATLTAFPARFHRIHDQQHRCVGLTASRMGATEPRPSAPCRRAGVPARVDDRARPCPPRAARASAHVAISTGSRSVPWLVGSRRRPAQRPSRGCSTAAGTVQRHKPPGDRRRMLLAQVARELRPSPSVLGPSPAGPGHSRSTAADAVRKLSPAERAAINSVSCLADYLDHLLGRGFQAHRTGLSAPEGRRSLMISGEMTK